MEPGCALPSPLLVGVTLLLIFGVVAGMLRSPVAALVVVGTVAVSYAAALGMAVLIWQDLAGHDLHWSVPAVSLIALIAVGADYNLLLAIRMREERHAGMATGTIRAFAGTGSVVTTAGLVFGLTNFPTVSTWAAFGMALRGFLSDATRLKWFNIAMGVLLAATLWPMLK